MKVCEYCDSQVPDETDECPNCAAHFPPIPPSWKPVPVEPELPASDTGSLLNRSLRKIGIGMATLFVLYLFLAFLGALGTMGPIMILPVILLVAAGVIIWRVSRG